VDLSRPFGDFPGSFLCIAHPLVFSPVALAMLSVSFEPVTKVFGYLAAFLGLPAELLGFIAPPLRCIHVAFLFVSHSTRPFCADGNIKQPTHRPI